MSGRNVFLKVWSSMLFEGDEFVHDGNKYITTFHDPAFNSLVVRNLSTDVTDTFPTDVIVDLKR